ncbi:MAG: beta-propeller domain-containing protein [Methanobacteriota archaeon]|nr:MAG: beta-propeller domain-containing protein [Euryarchaeota archaeon]
MFVMKAWGRNVGSVATVVLLLLSFTACTTVNTIPSVDETDEPLNPLAEVEIEEDPVVDEEVDIEVEIEPEQNELPTEEPLVDLGDEEVFPKEDDFVIIPDEPDEYEEPAEEDVEQEEEIPDEDEYEEIVYDYETLLRDSETVYDGDCGPARNFTGYDEMMNYMGYTSQQVQLALEMHGLLIPGLTLAMDGAPPGYSDSGSRDYSPTNIQVEGVDEPDIVKSDGEYLYLVTEKDVVIMKAYPGNDARIISRIKATHEPDEIFITDTRLVVFEKYNKGSFLTKVFDISSRSNPILLQNISIDGYYHDSRLIGDYVYVVAFGQVPYLPHRPDMPAIDSNGKTRTIKASEICYFGDPAPIYQFAIILSINLETQDVRYKAFLIDAYKEIYVSMGHIYIVHTDYPVYDFIIGWEFMWIESTIIHKISIDSGRIQYLTKGNVTGWVLNQFSMDEYEEHFRIATTTGHVSRIGGSSSSNNLYVLDDGLNVVGKLENLAPGERIYSARFMGDRGYLVTFKKVDPFFVIDLSDPESPSVLGELKIPGYSDYLHPYDESHVIGLGKDTYDMGDFAWYQGVKLSLFDVTDVSNPKEVWKYIIGDRGTDSPALSDHHAFLFSRSKDLLIIPILLAEINEEEHPEGVEPNTFGDYVFQGAYIFSLTLDGGFQLRGRITHLEDGEEIIGRWHSPSPSYVQRSLYIEDAIYTISQKMVKINDMDDLDEIKAIEL